MSSFTTLQKYYVFHSKIYDLTRWSFLFGRKSLVRDIAKIKKNPSRILEVGCGTGYVLQELSKQFPSAQIVGIDLSKDMLSIAEKKLKDHQNIELIQGSFGPELSIGQFDVLVFSYSLSMISEQWPLFELPTNLVLVPEGIIATVDFHQSVVLPFKRWMEVNHVEMNAKLPTWMEEAFETKHNQIISCYGNLWQYRKWIGQKKMTQN